MAILVSFEVVLFLCQYDACKEKEYNLDLDGETYPFPISMLKYMLVDWE